MNCNALAARDEADDVLTFDRIAAAGAVDHDVVDPPDLDSVLEPERLLDRLLDRRSLLLLELREAIGRKELGEDCARLNLSVAHRREEIVRACAAVFWGDALEVAACDELLRREAEPLGLLLEELPADID